MKVAIISSACCIHTRKWCNGLAEKGIEIHLVTQQAPMKGYNKDVIIHSLPVKGSKGYILNALALKKQINSINPDVVNVHYASGYGTLAMLAGIRNFVMSVWGSDVYDFPKKNWLTNYLINKNLNSSNIICSTSEIMAKHVSENFSLKQGLCVEVTPFGVDVDNFAPKKIIDNKKIIIGTVKTLRPKYGIDTLITAFGLLVNKGYDNVELKIAGVGHQLEELKLLAQQLSVDNKISFLGWVENNEVPTLLNEFDIYVAPSSLDSESFGVAIVEASSCGLPVIVSNVGGLPEVVIDNVTGIVVEPNDPEGISESIAYLIEHPVVASTMGVEGRRNVLKKYEWNNCVNKMIEVYNKNIILNI